MPIELINTRTGATALIRPETGWNCYSFRAPVAGQMVDVLDASPAFAASGENPNQNGIPLLFPFPNRVRGGCFVWNHREYNIVGTGHDGRGNAIHGLVIDRPWRVTQRAENAAVGEFRLSVDGPDRLHLWPADFVISVRYELRETTLRCEITASNPDRVKLPFGLGTHPYFRIPLGAGSRSADCLIQAPVTETWELIDCLPTGRRLSVSGTGDLREGQRLGEAHFDDVFTGLEAGEEGLRSSIMDPNAGLQIVQSTDRAFRELVVYTPPHRRSVCLEPYTCVTDAVNLQGRGIDAGWRTLEPGGDFRTWFEITPSLIYV